MNQRIIPWGTVIAGAIALGTAALIGLTEIGGVSLPVRSAGPGAVIVVGVLILVTGLFVVLRSNRAAGAGQNDDSPAPTITPAEPPAPAATTVPGPLDVTDPVDATLAVPRPPTPVGPDGGPRQSSH